MQADKMDDMKLGENKEKEKASEEANIILLLARSSSS